MRKPRHKSRNRARGPAHENASRDTALYLLSQWRKTGEFPDRSLEGLQTADALARELVWGCIRSHARLSAWVKLMSRQPPPDILEPALWIGLYQILELDGIKAHAAVNETVQAGRRAGFARPMLGYLNAVLRRAVREEEKLKSWMAARPLHIRESHPLQMLDRWEERLGPDATENLVKWNNQRGTTIVRRTALGQEDPKTAPGHEDFPYELEPHEAGPDWFVMPRGKNPVSLPGFRQGAWYVQDPSTRMSPAMLDAQPGEAILDACASPGGKTALLADAMQGKGRLVAVDREPARVDRLKENLERLQLPWVEAEVCDITKPPAEWENAFDAVLLDVPCSNTGVLQRRPDARWRFDADDMMHLTNLQGSILEMALRCVKPGGRLIYSTCSIEEEEGPEQVREFLKRHPNWAVEEERQLLPGEENCDGAFAARLRKPKS